MVERWRKGDIFWEIVIGFDGKWDIGLRADLF